VSASKNVKAMEDAINVYSTAAKQLEPTLPLSAADLEEEVYNLS
jgi:hypothetical protein